MVGLTAFIPQQVQWLMNVLKAPATAEAGRAVDRRSVELPLEAGASYVPEASKIVHSFEVV